MSGPAILLSLLFGTSVVMTIALAIAFAHFGRQRHVLTWTASYAVGVLQWLANVAGFFLQSAAMFIVTGTALVVSASLLAIGIRQRSSRRVNIMAFAAPAAIVCIMIAVAIGFFGNQVLQGMIIPTYVGLLLLVSAASLWPIDRAMTPPEKALVPDSSPSNSRIPLHWTTTLWASAAPGSPRISSLPTGPGL